MKPIGFESNDLSNCIPADLLLNGFKEDWTCFWVTLKLMVKNIHL
jgi:hypothetical protein